jgi:light-regulated signal transduction histidine kinase (bacteriophytochrome)
MAYADRLFSAFHRLHGDKDFKGSGIGLATVSRIIHRHHGKISAVSQVDNGATFTFSLE